MSSEPAKPSTLDEQVAAAAERYRQSEAEYQFAYASLDGTVESSARMTRALTDSRAAYDAYAALKKKQFLKKFKAEKKALANRSQACQTTVS